MRGTPEERHNDEERRLAHVAATRAKDRLTFVSVRTQYTTKGLEELEPSEFEPQLAQLDAEVFEVS